MRYWELTLPQKMFYWDIENKVLDLFKVNEEGRQYPFFTDLLESDIQSVWISIYTGRDGGVCVYAYKEKPQDYDGDLFEIPLQKETYHPKLVEIANQYKI